MLFSNDKKGQDILQDVLPFLIFEIGANEVNDIKNFVYHSLFTFCCFFYD